MGYAIYIAFNPNAAFPQTPQPGRNQGQDENGNPIPPDGMSLFTIQSDESELVNGKKNDDIERFYEVVDGPALRAVDAAEVEAVLLPERKATALASVREQARQHIEEPVDDPNKWPMFRQMNAEAGIYPAGVKDQKDKDIAATVEESNRVEVAIEDATTVQQVQDALDSINFPTFPVA